MGYLRLVRLEALALALLVHACASGSKNAGPAGGTGALGGGAGSAGNGETSGPQAAAGNHGGTKNSPACGDGEIDNGEECDDGNVSSNDGCTSMCKAELVFRLTRLKIVTDPAPDYCVYADNRNHGNAMGAIFPSPGMLDAMGGLLNGVFNDGSTNVLQQVLDLDNPAADQPDSLVTIGITQGTLAAGWSSQTDKLDFPLTVNSSALDPQGVPKTSLISRIVDKGNGVMEIQSVQPGKAGFTRPNTGDFTLYNAAARLEIDAVRSQPKSPPTLAAGLKLPETLGRDSDASPGGRLCGAMLASSFQTIGMPGSLATLCALVSATAFTPCNSTTPAKNPTKGECDSILTLLQKGCPPLLNPIGEPDADIDGDGINESYSVVVGMSAKRVKVTGIGPQ